MRRPLSFAAATGSIDAPAMMTTLTDAELQEADERRQRIVRLGFFAKSVVLALDLAPPESLGVLVFGSGLYFASMRLPKDAFAGPGTAGRNEQPTRLLSLRGDQAPDCRRGAPAAGGAPLL
jgi:hypothetical protein